MLNMIWVACKISLIILAAGLLFAWLARPAEAAWVKTRALPLTVGLYAAGMLLPSIWAMYVLITVLIPVLARSRAEAAALYIVTVLAVPGLTTELGIGSIYLLALDKWLFGAIGVTIAFFLLPAKSGTRAPARWFDLPFILVILLELAQARGNNFTSMLRIETNVALCYILPYFVITRSLRRPEDIRLFLTAICFTGFVLAIMAVFESRAYFLVYEAIDQRLGAVQSISSYSHQRSGNLRAAGSFGEATKFGIFLARAFIASLALRDVFRAKRYWLVALGIIALGLYATNARGPVLAMGVGLIAYDLYRKRYQSLAVKGGAIVILYAVALLVAQFSSSFAERIGYGDASSTTDYREALIRRGTEEILKHPFIGVSEAEAVASLADLKQGEGIVDFVNGYVFYGLTTGIPGLLALIGCFVLMATKAWANRKRFPRDPPLLQTGGAVFAIAFVTMICCLTSGFGGRHEIIFYLFIGVGSALTGVKPAKPGDEETVVVEPRTARASRTMRLTN